MEKKMKLKCKCYVNFDEFIRQRHQEYCLSQYMRV